MGLERCSYVASEPEQRRGKSRCTPYLRARQGDSSGGGRLAEAARIRGPDDGGHHRSASAWNLCLRALPQIISGTNTTSEMHASLPRPLPPRVRTSGHNDQTGISSLSSRHADTVVCMHDDRELKLLTQTCHIHHILHRQTLDRHS